MCEATSSEQPNRREVTAADLKPSDLRVGGVLVNFDGCRYAISENDGFQLRFTAGLASHYVAAQTVLDAIAHGHITYTPPMTLAPQSGGVA